MSSFIASLCTTLERILLRTSFTAFVRT